MLHCAQNVSADRSRHCGTAAPMLDYGCADLAYRADRGKPDKERVIAFLPWDLIDPA